MYCNVDTVKAREAGKEVVVNLKWISASTMYDTLTHIQMREEGKALLTQEIEKISGTNSVQDRTAMGKRAQTLLLVSVFKKTS